ncbi:hypothetical protein CAPTEDRAFT_203162 [Capitella teleta]|uniref:Uncharacterized protein n=1 Tax=Capitella teleta TaxID=283909 RepID=R7V9I6_CAPTE|nr:hypothetical protein CAPTEDRAFT_203162 [Capitella teleta]|eukprot:ELU13021.1 hypothetical protein CAPTEDRAFT_203162 [Capitella teleta]
MPLPLQTPTETYLEQPGRREGSSSPPVTFFPMVQDCIEMEEEDHQGEILPNGDVVVNQVQGDTFVFPDGEVWDDDYEFPNGEVWDDNNQAQGKTVVFPNGEVWDNSQHRLETDDNSGKTTEAVILSTGEIWEVPITFGDEEKEEEEDEEDEDEDEEGKKGSENDDSFHYLQPPQQPFFQPPPSFHNTMNLAPVEKKEITTSRCRRHSEIWHEEMETDKRDGGNQKVGRNVFFGAEDDGNAADDEEEEEEGVKRKRFRGSCSSFI